MDWSRIPETMRQQGPLYWAAAAAMAAGAALLAGTAWIRLRRRWAPGALQAEPPPGRTPAAGGTAPPAVPDARLEEIHARLATAACRMEALYLRRGVPTASGLKTSAHPVEHVNRRGHA